MAAISKLKSFNVSYTGKVVINQADWPIVVVKDGFRINIQFWRHKAAGAGFIRIYRVEDDKQEPACADAFALTGDYRSGSS